MTAVRTRAVVFSFFRWKSIGMFNRYICATWANTGKEKDLALFMVPEISGLTRPIIMVGRRLFTSWLTAYGVRR